MNPRRKAIVAGLSIGVLTGLQLHGVKTDDGAGHGDGDTASEFTRLVFHTDRPAGRAAFLAAYAVFTAWWVPHVLDPAKQPRRAS